MIPANIAKFKVVEAHGRYNNFDAIDRWEHTTVAYSTTVENAFEIAMRREAHWVGDDGQYYPPDNIYHEVRTISGKRIFAPSKAFTADEIPF